VIRSKRYRTFRAPVYSSPRASREAFVETRYQVTRRRFTAEEFHRMGEAGILREDERVELIEEDIVRMNPIGSRHAACVRMLIRLVGRSLGEAVERHSDPVEEGYRRMERAGRVRSLASELLPNLTLQTNAVLE
jgi:hypothetical protein